MSVKMNHEPESRALEVTMEGKLQAEDYETFVPVVEDLIKQYGSLDLLVNLHDFHGWTAGALWEDIKFDVKHFRDIGKLAIVGETKWEAGMAKFCKPFTTAEVRFFPREDLVAAREWIGVHATVN
ncbi:MAG: STAS/SEC14 domain-containing protein [Acidobacteria bacterium]|nr:STAS/SEC14 domain-containing protein [Acidobacteriota bacterium]